jgi:UDP-N-acetylmuramoylalanine--D-glutamate ligase
VSRVPELQNRRFSIIGAARSGLAVAALLKKRGAEVFVSEKAPADGMLAARGELERMGIPYEFGGNTERVLNASMLIVSPGVPSDIPVVKQALARQLAVVSELEVAAWFCSGPIVAITGTNGKTTTTSLAGRMFDDAKIASVVAGNIGTAFSQVVENMPPGGAAILEVSSFQLDHIVSFRPRVSVLLNITPDHLDRYDHSYEEYIAAKRRIFENQKDGDALIYNRDDEVTCAQVERARSTVHRLPFSVKDQLSEGAFLDRGVLTVVVEGKRSEIVAPEEMSLRGIHNLSNAMAATLVARFMGVPAASLRATLRNFKGVEHRLEHVRERNGVWFVNDSKATNVDSVWYALQSYTRPIIVIMGGRDKGNDYSRLDSVVRKHVKAVIAIGESAEKVVGAFKDIVPVSRAASMEEAVHAGAGLAVPGDVVLLSPACASFDWFQNYEHRGRAFKDAVMNLEE